MPKAGGTPQSAKFYEGVFKVTQSGSVTNLALTEPLASCRGGGRSAAATKKKQRHLWGDGKGAFRTTGKYSSATVRGTKWLVQDSCAGTLTRVVARHGHGPRPGAEQDGRGGRGQELPGQALDAAASREHCA